MPDVLPFPPERADVERAIALVGSGDIQAALNILRPMLATGRPPTTGPDRRPEVVIRLRAYVEQAVVELEHNILDFALKTLRLGLAVRNKGRPPVQ
jgi:hypothetical protein